MGWAYWRISHIPIEIINEQGEALRLHFEAVVAAVELPVPIQRTRSYTGRTSG
jgi:hypothetical protein